MAFFFDLESPVSTDEPCGIDLDSDPVMQSALTVLEGGLPGSYLGFSRKEFDDKAIIAGIGELLKTSRDVRLVVTAAKTFALADNFTGFCDSIAALAALLEKNWDTVHPRSDNDDYALRAAYVQSIDDRPTVLLPLQAATLIKDKRLGAISYRSFLLAQKPAMARDGETAHDEGTLNDAFMNYEPLSDITSIAQQVAKLQADLSKIRSLFIEHVSYEAAPKYDLVPDLMKEISGRLAKYVEMRLPAEVQEVSGSEREQAELGSGQEAKTTSKPD